MFLSLNERCIFDFDIQAIHEDTGEDGSAFNICVAVALSRGRVGYRGRRALGLGRSHRRRLLTPMERSVSGDDATRRHVDFEVHWDCQVL